MKLITICIIILAFKSAAYCQDGEMDKFYAFYKITGESKKPFDSVYRIIQQRRAIFSKEYKSYKDKNQGLDSFSYDGKDFAAQTVQSLPNYGPGPLKELIYYSYFDLGYGIYGIKLDAAVCAKALKEIKPISVIWAMEPSLFEKVIVAGGGDEKNASYINEVMKQNKDESLALYVKNNLSPDRALKKGNTLPVFDYVLLSDTTKVLSTANLRGKYYLVDIWATWCVPCIDELPGMIKEFKILNKGKIDFLSISIDDNISAPLKFLKDQLSLPWATGISIPRKKLLNALMITGIPCTILVDPEGKILSYDAELRGKNLHKTFMHQIK